MKRSIGFALLAACLVVTFVLAANAGARHVVDRPTVDEVGVLDVDTTTHLGQLCFCACQGPISSLEDVYTDGTCEELLGQECWSAGPGFYSFCIEGSL